MELIVKKSTNTHTVKGDFVTIWAKDNEFLVKAKKAILEHSNADPENKGHRSLELFSSKDKLLTHFVSQMEYNPVTKKLQQAFD
jgi:hypothetical protein